MGLMGSAMAAWPCCPQTQVRATASLALRPLPTGTAIPIPTGGGGKKGTELLWIPFAGFYLPKTFQGIPEIRNWNRDRRREPRAQTACDTTVEQAGSWESECVLENLSLSGACVYLNVELTPGTRASLHVFGHPYGK